MYIDGKNIEIEDDGMTEKKLKLGTHYVEIKDIDNVTNCQYMFFNCTNLVEAPLFDISKVENMYLMFYNCDSLNEQTKREWSQIYDFLSNKKKK